MAIVTTLSGSTSNSYCTLAEATAYCDDRLNVSDWTAASDAAKEDALLTACRRLNRENYAGYRVDPDQALAWPRYGAIDVDGAAIDSTTIPSIVANAQCELALFMLASDLTVDTGLEGFKRVTVGQITVEPNHGRIAGDLPAGVLLILAPVLNFSRHNIRLVRG